MWIRYLAKLKGEDGRFSERGLGEKEGEWWDLKEQLVLVKDQKKSK